ncbi:MAG: GNAT family N-acetyltransferase [Anaerolineales bacterium]|nr:GNAT family N-acetyltransferase [Anaerolineales bacterium]
MTSWTASGYTNDNDLQQMLDLLLRLRPADWISDYPSPDDLYEMMGLEDMPANTRLWFSKDGQPIAFAVVDAYSNLLCEFDPTAPDALQDELVAWGEERLRQMPPDDYHLPSLDAVCREEDSHRVAFLEQHGFVRQDLRTLSFSRPLDEPIPEPVLPYGFRIRPFAGEREVEAWVGLHRAAFGTEHMTAEERLLMMRAPSYNPDMDLVVEGPDGSLAAYCMCMIYPEENTRTGRKVGYTDPVATHPASQGRGLARALLFTGMRLLRQRGLDAAVLGTSSENSAMQAAAQAAGYQLQYAKVWFSKSLEPADREQA